MYLGIDIGTSSMKAVVIDESQRVEATRSAPLALARPQDGWSEQDPADWITAVEGILDHLESEEPGALATVRGSGLSGQMHGATLLDRQHRPEAGRLAYRSGARGPAPRSIPRCSTPRSTMG